MVGNKQDIEKYLVFQDDDKQFFWDELHLTKEGKTRLQEKTYYMLINGIAKHLGYDIQEVKIYLLSGCFGTHKLNLSKTEIEIPNKSKTSDLTKEEAIFFIDTLQTFCSIKNIPITLTPRELKSLYDTYN